MTSIENINPEKSLYINGQWQQGESTVANINPSDISETIGHFAQATAAQVDQA
ncbi:hypothetical protein JEM65_21390, partial [Gelidibacter salicanalis]|nr:hypothetical protein [Gelidibacter salicanalis]